MESHVLNGGAGGRPTAAVVCAEQTDRRTDRQTVWIRWTERAAGVHPSPFSPWDRLNESAGFSGRADEARALSGLHECFCAEMMVVQSSCNGMMDSTHPHAVLSRLGEQRAQGQFCDVTVVVEDIKFHAHRNVLAASSRYFHNAFTACISHTPNLVLELQDLKSDVFATVLDFIYSSRFSGTTDDRSIGAAGKMLGIPFLEKLLETETQTSVSQSQTFSKSQTSLGHTKLTDQCTLKNEVQRAEEQDCTKGPRITNAFSITEVLHSNDHLPPAAGRQADPETPCGEGDSAGAMSEHSYAVSKEHQPTENNKTMQQSDHSGIPPALSAHRLGPLKKRHRICKALGFASNETRAGIQSPDCSTLVQNGPPDSTSMLQASDSGTDSCSAPELLPPPEILPLQEADPPSLIPEDVPTSTTYRCLQCPEAFSSSALLTIHMQIHKRRFVSHLFCKFCHKKFIHLKRLRNHEQVCSKGPPQLEPKIKDASGGLDLNDPFINSDATCPSPDPNPDPDPGDPPALDPTFTSDPALVGYVKPNGRQRSYKCSMCKRAYVTLSSLKRHENVHSWQRAYPCHYCNKVFALAEYRTKHEIWHTGERRYQCIFCFETFLTYYILRNHQKSFHGVDPRRAMNKKSANGSFKGGTYPIKLYRLLPMKFRKKSYKTYSQTFSEVAASQELSASPLEDSSLKTTSQEGAIPGGNLEGTISSQSLFSMPVTFMATPKMVAAEVPRITFGQHTEESASPPEKEGFQIHTNPGLSGFASTVSPVFSYGYTTDSTKEARNDRASTQIGCETNTDLPFLNIPPVCSFEGLSKLSELSAAAQTIEAMANQLLHPLPESQGHNVRADRMTETYIAKPACPGPSLDNQVLPLCQITVKIGNEAIVRRKIKGSKLFPKRKKKRTWRPVDEQSDPPQEGVAFPNLRFRPEGPSSVAEDEQYEDVNDPENDKLWRPYYSYKPKRKSKGFRSRKQSKSFQYYTKPVSPEPDDDGSVTDCSPEHSVCTEGLLESSEAEMGPSDQKEDFSCGRCSRSFLTPSSLNMHIISCHQPRCKICAKLCPVEELPNVDRAEGFICRRCTEDGSCFSSDAVSRTLSCEKRYRCSYCPQRFLYLATKKSHEAKHLEKFGMEHSCRYCAKVCKSAVLLSLHENKHLTKVKEAQDTNLISRSPLSESTAPESPAEILPFAPKAEALEIDHKVHTKASPSPHKNMPHFSADQHKIKKKCSFEVSKDVRLRFMSEEQSLPRSSQVTQLNPCGLFAAGMSRVSTPKSLKSPKSEWRLCKEEPYD